VSVPNLADHDASDPLTELLIGLLEETCEVMRAALVDLREVVSTLSPVDRQDLGQ
jgi:hypothetical protein